MEEVLDPLKVCVASSPSDEMKPMVVIFEPRLQSVYRDVHLKEKRLLYEISLVRSPSSQRVVE